MIIARDGEHYDALANIRNTANDRVYTGVANVTQMSNSEIDMNIVIPNEKNSLLPLSEPSILNDEQVDDLTHTMRDIRVKYRDNIITAHININSVRNKFENITDLLEENLIDLLAITESKLDDSFTNSQFHRDGFKLYRNDRNKNGGGIMFYVRSDIPHRIRNELNCNTEFVESLIVETHWKNEKWLLIVIYNPHKRHENELIEYLYKLYEKEVGNYNEIICTGDLNIELSLEDNRFKYDIIDAFNLYNVISSPTCFKTNNGTLLDPIIVTNKNRYIHHFNLACAFSDFHNFVGCVTKYHLKKQQPRTILYRSFKHFDEAAFKKDVSLLKTIPECEDPNVIFSDYQNKLVEVCNRHAPIKKRVIKKQQVPYMNKQLRSAMYKRNNLRNKYYKDRNNETWEAYRSQRNKVTFIRRESIKKYFRMKCEGPRSGKDFWDTIKPFLTDKKSNGQSNLITLREGNKIISNPVEVCDIFNDFFASLANNIGKTRTAVNISDIKGIDMALDVYKDHPSILAIKDMNINKVPFTFTKVTARYVELKINKLNAKKAAGSDMIPPKLVKLLHKELATDMANIINICIEHGVFPNDMKLAEIAPLYKKLDSLSKDNYRPVNVIGVLSKLFEIILAEQLGIYFHDVFNVLLSAYRKKYSCQNSLLVMTEAWKEALDRKMYVGAILMDLSKAFDCLPPDLFISKLNAYKVSKQACSLLASYLSNRKQRVKLGNERSAWKETVKGVPQGSGLGPLIFNIFINDFFTFITQCNVLNYADDNTLYTFNHNEQIVIDRLQFDSRIAVKWFQDNFMQANPSKFQFIFLCPSKITENVGSSLPIYDTNIERTNSVKLLGVNIDDKLAFKEHVNGLHKKASRQLNAFKRISKNLQVQERELVYNSFVSSIFSFCPLVWHFCGKTESRRIEKLNERALRIVYDEYELSYCDLLVKTNKLSLKRLRMLNFAIELYRIRNGHSIDSMKIFDNKKDVTYNLRHKNQNVIPRVNTTQYGLQSFKYYTSHLWNQIPNDIKEVESINRFKSLIFSWNGFKCDCQLCSEY